MKRQLLFVLAAAVLLSVGQAVWAAPDGLIAYWPFDEGAGTTAADMSGNGNDGTLNGDAQWIEGVLGEAIQFSGSSGSYVSAPHIKFDNQTFTVALWVNPGGMSGDQTVFAQHQSGSTNLSLHFRIMPSGVARMGFYANDLDTPAGAVEAGIWTHITYVYDFETQDRRIYINGERAAEQAGAGPYQANTGETRVGQWNNGEWFDGAIDDVQVYHNALTDEEVLSIMDGLGDPTQAKTPSPVEDAIDVPRDLVLAWGAGDFAVKHDVYLGTSADDVNDATAGSALMIGQGLTDTALDAGRLEFDQTYFWRVDEVNGAPDNTVFKGAIWSFTVEPHGRPITGITVTASSSNAEAMGPEKTIDGSGLNELDQHGTAATDMWLSGMGDATPSLEYTFDKAYKLDQMLVWNSNQMIESFIGLGAKDVIVETSLDGVEWAVLEGATLFNQAPGNETYEANTIIDLAGTLAQYAKITVNAGWGMLPQYGLSEVRFLYVPTFASEPEPADGSAVNSANVTLAWRAGREAGSHQINLGTDAADLPLVATTSEASYAADGLDYSTTYYWSITEVNDNEAVPAHAGDVWSFTTPDFGTVDDFDQYDDKCDRIFFSWEDGLGHSGGDEIDDCDVPASNGNGGGSIVGNDQAPFAEKTIVKPGSIQSLPFNYDNSFGDSFTSRALNGQDWTASGIQTLALAFNGTEGNTGTLYVKINNTKIVYDGGPADIARAAWQAWNIDLSGVSGLQNVTSLSIGVDGANAAGMLYIDNIRLYPLAGEFLVPVQPDDTALAAYYTFDEGAGAVVGDSSGNGNNGAVVGTPQWVAGKVGGAMLFSGFENYVDCGNDASVVLRDAVTVACWIKVDAFVNSWETIVGMGDDSYRMARSNGTDNGIHFGANGTATGGNLNGSTIVTTNTWRHAAVVYDGTNNYVYIDGFEDARAPMTGQINVSAHNLYIGENAQATGRFLNGAVDDLRIYGRGLSPEEIAGLAGLTGQVHKSF
jgi:hypothetical protein